MLANITATINYSQADTNVIVNELINGVNKCIALFPHHNINMYTNQACWINCKYLTLSKKGIIIIK